MKVFKRSIRNVLRNPLRLILVVVLLSTSLMFVAAMVSLSTHAQNALAAVHQQLGTAITVRHVPNEPPSSGTNSHNHGGISANEPGSSNPTTPVPLPNSLMQKIKSIPGVVGTEERLVRPASEGTLKGTSVNGPGGQLNNIVINVNGFSKGASHFTLSQGTPPTLVAGRNFQDSDANAYVAMMSQELAQINHLALGSTFTLQGKTFTLIGLFTTTDQFSQSSIVIPMAIMQQVFGINGVDSMIVYAKSYEQVEAVVASLRQALGKQYDVSTQAAQYSGVFSAIGAAQKAIQLALIVSIGIAVMVTIFAVLMLVRERTAEIAILKTIGASHLQILRQFWTEIVILSITAAVIAVLLLAALGPIVSQQFTFSLPSVIVGNSTRMQNGTVINEKPIDPTINNIHLAPATLNAQTFLLILGLGIGLALLTSMIPTWFISHIKPAEILRKTH